MDNYKKLYIMSYNKYGDTSKKNKFIMKRLQIMFKKIKKNKKEKKYGYSKEDIDCILEQDFTKDETIIYF